eukprot:3175286-Prymnesium_polylepis.1
MPSGSTPATSVSWTVAGTLMRTRAITAATTGSSNETVREFSNLKAAVGAAAATGLAAWKVAPIRIGRWRQASSFAKTAGWQAAVASGVAVTSVVPSAWLAVQGAVVFSAAYVTTNLADGFFKGDQSKLRESSFQALWPPLAAYMAVVLSAPLMSMHIIAFRLLPWWPKAMAGASGLMAALGALYVRHILEERRNLEAALETMVGPPQDP